eukprot:jgi/Botrbrau1/7739/Bobra.0159s0169.1
MRRHPAPPGSVVELSEIIPAPVQSDADPSSFFDMDTPPPSHQNMWDLELAQQIQPSEFPGLDMEFRAATPEHEAPSSVTSPAPVQSRATPNLWGAGIQSPLQSPGGGDWTPEASPMSTSSLSLSETLHIYNTRRLTAEFLKSNIELPTFHGGHETVRQAVYSMLELKYKHGETDACLEDICRLMHHCKLPRPNIHPPSLHLCMRVAECRDFKATMKHVCGGGCTAFSTLAPSDYANHLQDTCIECGGLRIVQEKLGVKTNLRPARVVYDLGVGNAIQQLFHDEEFCKMRGSGRDTQGDYYQSPEASRLHAAAMADIKDKDTSVYELGMD